MTSSSSDTPTIDISNSATKEGLQAGRSAAKQLGLSASATTRHEWICAFLKGFLEYGDAAAGGSSLGIADDAENHPGSAASQTVPQLFAARVVAVEEAAEGAFVQVSLDVAGSGLVYHPGCSVALWPSNDPNTVRDIIRALSISAQTQVVTASGTFPIWQVLLEQLDLSSCPSSSLVLMAEYARNPDEAQRLLQLARSSEPHDRSLLTLLRRFPQVKPPIQRLLSRLAPIVPMSVPVASLLPDGKVLTFTARLGIAPVTWGRIDAPMRSRLRVGEWITISTELERTLALPGDDMVPTVIVATPLGCALAQAYVSSRQASNARGRTWIVVLAGEDEAVLGLAALQSLHEAGHLGRFDLLRGATVQAALKSLGAEEETFWRWLVDQSCLCFAVEVDEMVRTCETWLVELLMRRGRCSPEGATTRIRELESAGRILRLAERAA